MLQRAKAIEDTCSVPQNVALSDHFLYFFDIINDNKVL